jgi:cardiolipin synthase
MSLLRRDRWQSIQTLKLLEGGKDYFARVEAVLKAAKKSIYLEVYIFSADSQAKKIVDILCFSARQGVEVRVILDWLGSAPFQHEKDFLSAGVQYSYYNPAWFGPLGFSRTHRKLIVVDEVIAFVGGVNICDDSKDVIGNVLPGMRWDLALEATGTIVEKVHAAFLRQWQRLQPNALHPKNILKRILEQELPWSSSHFLGLRHGNKEGLAFIARDNLHHRRDIERAYLKAIGQARDEIWLVTPYFLPGRRLRKALVNAANRGVSVNLLLGMDEFKILNWAVPSLYGQLLAANVAIYEYPKALLHTKAMVVDRRWATLGSSNCDHLSFLLNHEANLIIRNHQVIKEIRWKISDQANDNGIKVEPNVYAQRSYFKKVFNWMAYVFVRATMSLLTISVKDKEMPKTN